MIPTPADMAAAFFSDPTHCATDAPHGFFAAGIEAERQRAAEAWHEHVARILADPNTDGFQARGPVDLQALLRMTDRLITGQYEGDDDDAQGRDANEQRALIAILEAAAHEIDGRRRYGVGSCQSGHFVQGYGHDEPTDAEQQEADAARARSPLISRMRAASADARRIGEADFAQVMDVALTAIAIADERTKAFRVHREVTERERDNLQSALTEAKAEASALIAEKHINVARKLIYREIEVEDGYQIGMGRTAEHDDDKTRRGFGWCVWLLCTKQTNGIHPWRTFWLKLARLSISAIESYDRGGASRVDP